ncbi:MAG: sulfurtransferase TusA family protein [Candidatus Bathyarchaeia archaeon]
MTAALSADKSLDARGLFCPEPIYRTRMEIESINVGQTLEVLADDPAAEEDIKVWSRRTGHELLLIENKGNHLRFLVKRTK